MSASVTTRGPALRYALDTGDATVFALAIFLSVEIQASSFHRHDYTHT
jgi:hypothetical protein